jgi:hypothetical protein
VKMIEIVWVFVAFTVIKALILAQSASVALDFPTLELPEAEFHDLSAGCGGFVDCIEFLGFVLMNIAESILFVVKLLVSLVVFVFGLFVFTFEVLFGTIDGAPGWLNGLLFAPYIVALSLIIYKMIRKGSTDA